MQSDALLSNLALLRLHLYNPEMSLFDGKVPHIGAGHQSPHSF